MIFKTQKQMFEWIWETRPHVSELSGEPLLPKGHFKWHWQFLHVLPKGSYPSMKLDPDNILLGLPDEHSHQERYEVFKDKKIELKRKYAEEHKIKKYGR
jgi:hypothetical protein